MQIRIRRERSDPSRTVRTAAEIGPRPSIGAQNCAYCRQVVGRADAQPVKAATFRARLRGAMVIRERFEWRHAALALLGLLGVVALSWYRGTIGDYQAEAAPAINALARLDFHNAIAHQAN